MPTLPQEKPRVRVTYDNMEAYILLARPEEGEEYTVSYLKQALSEKGVTSGIDEEKLSSILANHMFREEVLVAKGSKPVDGVDGYYDFNFNTHFDGKPKILADGSVDYWSVHSLEQVREGQVIATYHPAIEGKDGYTVNGKILQAKRGREHPPLKGKGFERVEGKPTYVASLDGKIEMQNDRIVILAVHEVYGNAELTSGNIDFRGDVVIHGNVEEGVKIKATGSITVDGVVEACELEAGKGIILRGGMLGGNKAIVKAKGDITARFFEFTTIECDGDIHADVMLECDVTCQGQIFLNSSKGKIIGGNVRAIRGIEVTTLGNDAEKRTYVYVGAGVEIYSELREIEKKIETTRAELDKIEETLKQFAVLEQERGVSYANDPRRMGLLRMKIKNTALLASDEAEETRLRILADSALGATVRVLREVYPGVTIHIDEMLFTLKNIGRSIEFYKQPDKIGTRPCC
ncbi:MAG: FapA family protein [Clostridiales bacterium]|nr:FapA family protein [Clostridiales bacterium]